MPTARRSPRRLRRADDRARHPRPRGPADRAGDGNPLRPHPDQRTHTHHAPTTVTVHGYERDEAFTRQVEERIVAAARRPPRRLGPVTFLFRLGEESSVGKNSRLLLGDGTIYWVGTHDDAVRPTGPFDPELPVLAFRRSRGAASRRSCSTTRPTRSARRSPGVRSPSFYGLAAQELEKERGGTFLFFEGASGSTHNLDVATPEADRTGSRQAVSRRPRSRPQPRSRSSSPGRSARRSRVKVRTSTTQADDAAVVAYCTKRIKDPTACPNPTIETFRAMRETLAPRQGQERKTWVQAVRDRRRGDRGRPRRVLHGARPGDQAPLALPLYLCLRAGQRLRRLHPRPPGLRPGRLPGLDRPAQLPRARGSGETIVAAAVGLLRELHDVRISSGSGS